MAKERTLEESVAQRKRQKAYDEFVYGERSVEEAIEQNKRRRWHLKIPDNPRGNGKPVMLEFEGKTQNLSAWARERGISAQVIHHRLKKGYPIEMVLRVGRVTKSEHPDSAKAQQRKMLELAHEAICSLEPLWTRPLTAREILALVEGQSAVWRRKGLGYYEAIFGLKRIKTYPVSFVTFHWLLKKISGITNKRKHLCKVSNDWVLVENLKAFTGK